MNPPNTDRRSLPKLGNIRRVQCVACSQIACPVTQFSALARRRLGLGILCCGRRFFRAVRERHQNHSPHPRNISGTCAAVRIKREGPQWTEITFSEQLLQRKLTHVLCWHSHLASPVSESSQTGSSSRSQGLRFVFTPHSKSQERPWAAASQPACSQISDTPKTQEIKRFERFGQLGTKGELICYLQTGLQEDVIIGSTEVFFLYQDKVWENKQRCKALGLLMTSESPR